MTSKPSPTQKASRCLSQDVCLAKRDSCCVPWDVHHWCSDSHHSSTEGVAVQVVARFLSRSTRPNMVKYRCCRRSWKVQPADHVCVSRRAPGKYQRE